MLDFKLYVILDTGVYLKLDKAASLARKMALAGADIIQLRSKHLTDRQILRLGLEIKKGLEGTRCLFILNDRADLAKRIDAHGVHLGQDDLPIEQARKILGKNKIIGLSTHSAKQANQAKTQALDYIAIGPVFATAAKPKHKPLTLSVIPKIKIGRRLPIVAIGGINLNNIDKLLKAGIKRVAVCRAILQAPDITRAVKQFLQRLG